MERVRFLEHKGRKVLLLDFNNCTEEDVIDMMQEAQKIVTSQPPLSMLTLSDYSGGHFSRAAVQDMKETAARDRPYVKREAVVGIEGMPKALYKGLRDFSTRRFPGFKNREEALAWLVEEELGQSAG